MSNVYSRIVLVCSFRCGGGVNRYAHHGGTQDASVKKVTRLKNLQNRALVFVRGFRAIHGLMQMRIESHTQRIDSLRAKLRNIVNQLFVNELEAFAIIRV